MNLNLNNLLNAPGTTAGGVASGVGTYVALVGPRAPESTGDFVVLGISALFTLLGMLLPTIREALGLGAQG